MSRFVVSVLAAQFEAALCMLYDCIRKCPRSHWGGLIAQNSFGQVVYHTLFYVDYYMSANEAAFTLREIHLRGGDERLDAVSPGIDQAEALEYLATCRRKVADVLASETAESLQEPSGFSRLPFSRFEMHLDSLRHVQHHAGQLSAYLRRIVEDGERWWAASGWRGE